MEPRVPSHKLRKDEFAVPEDAETPHISEPVHELSEEEERASPDPEDQREPEFKEDEEEDDDFPDAGAIEEEPSEGSDVSQAAPSEQASSSSSGDDQMVSCFEAFSPAACLALGPTNVRCVCRRAPKLEQAASLLSNISCL